MAEKALAHIKVDNGKLEFDIDPEVMDDIEVIEMLDNMDSKPGAVVGLLKRILGDDLYAKVKEHYTAEYGRMSISKHLGEVFQAVFEAFPKSQA